MRFRFTGISHTLQHVLGNKSVNSGYRDIQNSVLNWKRTDQTHKPQSYIIVRDTESRLQTTALAYATISIQCFLFLPYVTAV